MSSDGEALFRAICEQPWEDTPRLMYADWLDESGIYNGEVNTRDARLRAAFIRHQIAMTRGDERSIRTHPELMFTTFHGCVERWANDLPSLSGVHWHAQFFQRGFVPGATFGSPSAFSIYAPLVFAAAPISRVCFYQMTAESFANVVASNLFNRVAALDVSGPIGDAGAALIARSSVR